MLQTWPILGSLGPQDHHLSRLVRASRSPLSRRPAPLGQRSDLLDFSSAADVGGGSGGGGRSRVRHRQNGNY